MDKKMISDYDLECCSLERRGNQTYLITPEEEISCALPIPPQYSTQFQPRFLTHTEQTVIKALRDRGQYHRFDDPCIDYPDFEIGQLIAYMVARNSNCITVNMINEETLIPLEYQWSIPSNRAQRPRLGGTYDLVTKHGIATAIVIDKLGDEISYTSSEMVCAFILSDVQFEIEGTDRAVRQLSKVEIDSQYLVPRGDFLFN